MENKPDGKLRAGFKQFNKFMLLLWRLGLGPWVNMWPDVSGRIMVLVHIGRKSGQRRFTPVNYAIIDGDIFCVAGYGSLADWYRNIKADSKVEVMLPDGWWEGKAEEIVDVSGNLPVLRQVLVASGIVAPMMGVRPKKMDRREADLIGAKLKGADLRGASLRGAHLIGADLRGADLRMADLTGADLRAADLRGANLTGSIFLIQSQLESAKGDTETTFPPALTRPAHWSPSETVHGF